MSDHLADELHILVIDDEPAIRELITEILLPDGHQVVAVSSAEEGLEQLPYFQFEVAFLDHNLPGMEGLVLGEFLKENNPHMQIALVTGAVDKALPRFAEQHGIRLIAKPFTVSDILDVVTSHREALAQQAVELARDEARARSRDLLQRHLDEIGAEFDIPGVPRRIEEILAIRLRELMQAMRAGPITDEQRASFVAGVVTSRVLGIKLPKANTGRPWEVEYDELMVSQGLSPWFGTDPS